MSVRALIICVCTVFCLATQPAHAQSRAADSLFQFHNGLWVNLHHLLYLQARASLGLDRGSAERLLAESDTAGFGGLSEREKAAWTNARAFYANHYARRNATFDSSLIRITRALGEHETERSLPGGSTDSSRFTPSSSPVLVLSWHGGFQATCRTLSG